MPTKASPTAASASSRADRLAAGRDVAHDVEGDLDLDADHVHGLAVERAGDFTSAPASSGAGLGSAVGVRAPTFQPATGPVARATPSWMA